MFSSRLYYPVYFLVITLATLSLRVTPTIDASEYPKRVSIPGPAILLCLFLVVFVGLRPSASIFADMSNYYQSWMLFLNEPFRFDIHTSNIIFDNLFRFFASIGFSITAFYVLIAFVYFFCILVACNKLFPSNCLFSYLVYLAAFSTLSYATNGIKAGAAAAIFLLAIAYSDKWYLSLLFLLLSYGFHHSMELPIAGFIIVKIFKNPNYYFYLWLLTLFVAILHVTFFMDLFSRFGDDSAALYLVDSGEEWFHNSGFRIDFVVYSAVPIILGRAINRKHYDEKYTDLLNLYMFCNSVWMLCMYAAFTNRIAYLSWFLYPIVLVYPFLKISFSNHQFSYAKITALLHVAFSLFMFFIFYGSRYR